MEKSIKNLHFIIITLFFSFSGHSQSLNRGETEKNENNFDWLVYTISTNTPPHEWACEPSIAVNPKGNQIIAGSVLDQVHRTNENGNARSENWSHQTLVSPYGVWGDPIIQYDYDGRAYFLHLATPNGKKDGDYLDRIVLQYSDDHGITWSSGSSIGYNPPKDQDMKNMKNIKNIKNIKNT